MHNKKIYGWALLVVVLSLSSAMQVCAQDHKLEASLSHYGTVDGLCSNSISYITQDDYGYLWLATWNGLSRFDGYNFYNYRTGNGSHIPHMHNRVLDLVIDGMQNVWMRMYDGRVFVLDRMHDKIVSPFESITGGEDFLTDTRLMATSSGKVLVSIKDVGLYIMRIDRYGIHSQLVSNTKYAITSMVEGYQSDVWLGTNHGVHRLDMANLSIERNGVFQEEEITCLYSNGYNIYGGTRSGKIVFFAYGQDPKVLKQGGAVVWSVFVDSQGLVWFNDNNAGSNRLDLETGEIKHFSQVVPVPQYDGNGGRFNEAAGHLWVRMSKGGYGYYNRNTDEVEYFHNDPSYSWNLNNTQNAGLELDEGVIWQSTARKGLEKLELLKNTIERKRITTSTLLREENDVRAIYFDEQADLLFIGNKAGVLTVNGKAGTIATFSHDSRGNDFGRFYGISKAREGMYLLCSKDKGLFIMTRKGDGWQIQSAGAGDDKERSMNSLAAYKALLDRRGNIWVVTYGGGVNVLAGAVDKAGNLHLDKAKVFHPDNSMPDYPYQGFRKLRSIEMDDEGNIWAGGTDGLLVMSLKRGEFSIQRVGNSRQYPDNILMSNDVVCLAKDRDGTIWIGTNGGGISRVVGQDSDKAYLFENFTARDGLPSEEIWSITFDEQGKVWFATDNTICSMEPEKHIVTTYTSLDGVDDTQISEAAAVSLPNKEILFGTMDGIYLVNRSKLTGKDSGMLKLRITDFFLDDQLQSPRFDDTYDYYVPDARSVKLPSGSHVVAFRFASLNYQLQHRVHYQYKLEGYDPDWINAPKTRTASYNSLPSGTYLFRVKAFLLESPEKYDLRTVELIVPPPFLLSSGAIWIYMLLAVVVALVLMLHSERRLWADLHPGKPFPLFGVHGDDSYDATFGAQESASPAGDEPTDYYEVMSDEDIVEED